MRDTDIKTRCENCAQYVIETGATVRKCAERFGISKSTVHKDLTEKLKYYNKALYIEVLPVLRKNKAERHIRGGEATRNKYIKKNRANKKGSPHL